MQKLSLPQGILFDLDETLIDRRRSIARYVSGVAERFAAHLEDVEFDRLLQAYVDADGRGYRDKREGFAELIDAFDWKKTPTIEELLTDWRMHFARMSEPKVGLLPLFEALHEKGIRLGVVTNGGKGTQNLKIDTLGIRDYLTAVIVSDAVGVRKPDPEIFRLAFAELGLPPADVWFVGDHPVNDVLGASACGMTGIWMTGSFTWPADQPPPAYRIDELGELLCLNCDAV